jgi:hypothetical protein
VGTADVDVGGKSRKESGTKDSHGGLMCMTRVVREDWTIRSAELGVSASMSRHPGLYVRKIVAACVYHWLLTEEDRVGTVTNAVRRLSVCEGCFT